MENNNSLSIASLSLGCVAILFNWVPLLGLACGIVGIILAVKASKVHKGGLTTGGLVTSIVGTCLSVLIGTCIGIGCITGCAVYNSVADSYDRGGYDYGDYDYGIYDDGFHW